MGASGAGVDSLAVLDLHHTAAANAHRANIQGVQIGLVAAHLCVADHNLAVLDTGNIGGGAAHLEEQAVGELFIHQRTGNTCCGAGENGQNGTVADLGHGHHAAVAAHDHQGTLDAGGPDALIGHGGSLQHLGHDAGVDHGGTGTDLQAVELGDIVGGRTGQFCLPAQLHSAVFMLRVIDTESFRCNKALAVLGLQILQSLPDHRIQIGSGGFHVGILGFQILLGCQLDAADGGVRLTLGTLQTLAQSHNADLCHVAFQQGIGCLGGAVGNEINVLGRDVVLLHHPVQHLDDAGGNAFLGAVGGGRLDRADQLIGVIIDGDGIGKSAANVNANTNFHVVEPPLFFDQSLLFPSQTSSKAAL